MLNYNVLLSSYRSNLQAPQFPPNMLRWCRIAPDATAFKLCQPGAEHLTYWVTWKEPPTGFACMTWHNKIFERLKSYAGRRVYANYMSTPCGTNAKSVFGSNLVCLKQVKKKYDPNNIFHLNQNILPE